MIATFAVLAGVILVLFVRRPGDSSESPLAESPKVVSGDRPQPAAKADSKPVAPSPKAEPRPETPKPPTITPASSAELRPLLGSINDVRKAAGLRPVVVDDELSNACRTHAENSLARIAAAKSGKAIEETVGGNDAAKAPLLAAAEPAKVLPQWIGRVQSRLPLLHPDLERIGIAAAQTNENLWVTVADVTGGRGTPAVVFPAAGQEDVPLTSSGGPESGDAAGFPVSLQFPTHVDVTDVQASLADDRGNRLPIRVSTPQAPLPGVRRPGLIGMIPVQPLHSQSKYHARVAALVDGRPFKKEWSFTTEDDSDEFGEQAAKMLKRINAIRKLAGLDDVTLDDPLSAGCRAHAQYLVVNARRPETQGLGVHREDPKLPGYSPLGDRAAKASDIAIGDFEPTNALDGWMATLYHRVPILDPGLKKVGFGCARGSRLGWVTVLDIASGREKSLRLVPVLWPVDGQMDVPLHFPPGGEIPNPIPEDATGRAGYPITAAFPRDAPLKSPAMALERADGTKIACWSSSPESPANAKFSQGTTVCLIPKAPLPSGERLRVILTGDWRGEKFKRIWSFTTGKAGPNAGDAVQQAVDRFNLGRTAAGLPAVTLDVDLSKACQAHADYLVRNATRRGDPKVSVNDESPGDPGFTEMGQAAARRSDIFSLAPSPTSQIDDLFGSLHRRSFALDPRLRRIGLGCTNDVGVGWVNVLDLSSGRDVGEPVVFPKDGQKNVPIVGNDRLPRRENEAGFPITVSFPSRPVTNEVEATLRTVAGKAVDVAVFAGDTPIDAKHPQPNVIVVVPREPLSPGTGYVVSIRAKVDGAAWMKNVRFATASR